MWVRLTRRGYYSVLNAVAGDPDMTFEFTLDDEPQGARIDVEAPYAAWWYAQQRLMSRVFGPRGGRAGGVPAKDFVALRAITRELNIIDKHPALVGKQVVGWYGVSIPAWKRENRTYSPYPQPGRPFAVLRPDWYLGSNGIKLTRWVETSDAVGRMADESVHLALWRHPGHP